MSALTWLPAGQGMMPKTPRHPSMVCNHRISTGLCPGLREAKLEILKITKADIQDGEYIKGAVDFDGNVEIDENLGYVFFASLKATGYIYAKAGCGIKAGEGIEVGWGIKAGEGIEVGWGIEAGWGIKAGAGIEAGWGIKAGEGI